MSNLLLRWISGVGFGVIFWGTYYFAAPIYFSILLVIFGLTIAVFEWKNFFSPRSVAFWCILPFYPVLPMAMLIYLNQLPDYRILTLVVFVVAFFFDTGSYMFGKRWGCNKICPSISPGKSWEGFGGGIVFAFIAMVLLRSYHHWSISLLNLFLLSVSLSIFLLLGDLFESFLKRRAGIKDSGNLMPGHGGFLDRADGIFFAAYFVFLGRNLILQLLY